MSCGSPYIGSKISLISKMKIRYEGILYTINTDDATVALAKVKSYGTEGRKCERQVAARDEVYEYIIFRGADIYDLTVCEPPKPVTSPTAPTLTQDPAIVQSVVTSQSSSLPPLVGSNYAPPPIGYNAYPSHNMGYQPMAPGQMPADPNKPPMLPPSNLQNPLKSGMEKSDNMGRSSPTSEQGVQAGGGSPSQNQSVFQQSRRTYESNDYYNSGRSSNFQSQRGGFDEHRGRGRYQRGHDDRRDAEFDSRGRGQRRGDYRGDFHSSNYRGNRPQRGGRRYTPRNDPLRFDGDFDFETSNALFNKEEITRELLSKLKITPGDKTSELKKDEEVEEQKAEEESSEVLEDSEGEEEDETVYYDKGKSFFDNITCETTNPRGERMSWTEERKKNSETFGIHWRGRGRGGYRGRGYRSRGRGGYRGRGGGYHQRNDDNRQNYYNNRQNYYNNNNRNDHYNNKSDYNNRSDHYNRGGDQQQQQQQHDGSNWRSNNYRSNRGAWGNNRNQWVNYQYKDDKNQHHRHDNKDHSQAKEVTATAS